MEWDAADRPANDNYRFLCASVMPRPIAWITTQSRAGIVNAAPFSWFNAVCQDPILLSVSIADRRPGEPKDTVRNLRDTGEAVVNVVPAQHAPIMVQTSAEYPADVSEVTTLGLATVPSPRVRPPRLALSPVHFECVVEDIRSLGNGTPTNLVLLRAIHVHADDGVLDERGLPDPARMVLAARMGGQNYCDTGRSFALARPAAPR